MVTIYSRREHMNQPYRYPATTAQIMGHEVPP